MKKIISIIIIVSIIVLALFLWQTFIDEGYTSWGYSEGITLEFYEQYVPQGFTGNDFKVYIGMPHDMGVNLDIIVIEDIEDTASLSPPLPPGNMIAKGTYNILDEIFEWEWKNFPFE